MLISGETVAAQRRDVWYFRTLNIKEDIGRFLKKMLLLEKSGK